MEHMAPFCVVAAGICWGIIGLFTRQLSAYGLSPLQITFGRALVTAIAMAGVALFRQPRSLAIAPRDIWMFQYLLLHSHRIDDLVRRGYPALYGAEYRHGLFYLPFP